MYYQMKLSNRHFLKDTDQIEKSDVYSFPVCEGRLYTTKMGCRLSVLQKSGVI